MSQQQSFGSTGTPGAPNIEFVQGNSGGQVPPNPATFTINIVGDTAQGVNVNGNAGTYTETVTVQNATAAATAGAANKGVSSYSSDDFVVTSGFVTLARNTSNTAQTVGAVNANLITLPLGATPMTYALEGRVAAFESTTPAGAGFQVFATVRTDGATATLVGIPDIVGNTEAAINTAQVNVVVSGNNAIIQVSGVAALTIDWGGDLAYTTRG